MDKRAAVNILAIVIIALAVTAAITFTVVYQHSQKDDTEVGYSIEAESNDFGTVSVDSSNAEEGSEIVVSAVPMDGFVLKGIFVNGHSIEGNKFTMPAEDVIISAVFKKAINVQFINWDDALLIELTVAEGDVPEYTGETPVKAGNDTKYYSFSGWDKDIVAAVEDVVYRAIFVEKDRVFTITGFSSEEGRVYTESADSSYGERVALIIEAGEGFDLVKGSLKVKYGPNEEAATTEGGTYYFTMPASDVLIEAAFERIYAVTVTGADNGNCSVDSNFAAAGRKVKFTVEPDAGYRLMEGYPVVTDSSSSLAVEKIGEGEFSFTMQASAVTIDVKFEAMFKVTANSANGSINVQGELYAENELVTFTIVPDENYRIKDGSLSVTASGTLLAVSSNADSYTFIMPASDVEIIAEFERIFSITINADTEVGTVETDSNTYAFGDKAKLKIIPAEGYRLKEGFPEVTADGATITVSDDGENKYSFDMPAADVLVKVQFERIFSVEFLDGDGKSIVIQMVAEGEDAVPPENPVKNPSRYKDYTFTGWEDYTNITSDRTVNALFNETDAKIITAYFSVTIKNEIVKSPFAVEFNENGFDMSRYAGINAPQYTYNWAKATPLHVLLAAHEDTYGTDLNDKLDLGNGFVSKAWGIANNTDGLWLRVHPHNVSDSNFFTTPDGQASDMELVNLRFVESNLWGQWNKIVNFEDSYRLVSKDTDFSITVKDGSGNKVTNTDIYEVAGNLVNTDITSLVSLGKTDEDGSLTLRFNSSGPRCIAVGSGEITTFMMIEVVDGNVINFSIPDNLRLDDVKLDGTAFDPNKGTVNQGQILTFRITPTSPSSRIKSVSAEETVLTPVDGTYTYTLPDNSVTVIAIAESSASVSVMGLPTGATVKLNGTSVSSSFEAFPGDTITFEGLGNGQHPHINGVILEGGQYTISTTDSGKHIYIGVSKFSEVIIGETTNGSVTVDKSLAMEWSTVTVTVAPNEGYGGVPVAKDANGTVLDMWYDHNNDKYLFTVGSSDVTITASFSLRMSATPSTEMVNGTVSLNRPSYAEGETAIVTSEPSSGYRFKENSMKVETAHGVTVNVNYSWDGTASFIMPSEAVVVYAEFVEERTITVLECEHGSLTIENSVAIAGETVVITIMPENGYEIQGKPVVTYIGGSVEVI